MRILQPVQPTAEQLKVLRDTRAGAALIKGAAGSGKTTTALYRLKLLCNVWLNRRQRIKSDEPARVLVLTYNRTLAGYIAELARQQVQGNDHLELTVTTFSKWALGLLPTQPQILGHEDAGTMIARLARGLPGKSEFWAEEVDYLLGRFPHDHLDSYLTRRRGGRGVSPRVDKTLRERLLDEVVTPYQEAKRTAGVMDWNDIALAAGSATGVTPWDVVVVDEAQDFSANQVRSVFAHLAEPHSITFVMDAAQRIYPRFFNWNEVGITIPAASNTTLKVNYRNTRQIAAFAAPLVEDLPLDGDGEIPDFTSCTTDGPLPTVVAGTYSAQLDYILDSLSRTVDFTNESVVFLQPLGGRWFDYLRDRLERAKIPYVQLTRNSVWPSGSEAIALSTLHSAKGLEFDHVVLPGLNRQVTPHGDEAGDVYLDRLRRLIAMGVGRARKSVHIGFKPTDPSTILGLLEPDTYTLVTR